MPAPPRIAIAVATIEPWPAIQPCLDRLVPQVRAAGGELILADGTFDGSAVPPTALRGYGPIRTIAVPGASVLALRARAVETASAPLLAFTEDHCVVQPSWVQEILRAHADHPEADMVSGPVTNGSTDGLMDWANFIMTFAEFLPPAPTRPLSRTPPMSNASFRRAILHTPPVPEGWLEIIHAPMLVLEHRLHYDNAIVVSHVQPRGAWEAIAIHFHNGRTCAGLALPHMASRDWWARLRRTPALPWYLFASVRRSLAGREVPRRARWSLPAVWVLCVAHALGEFTGLIGGAGRSALRLN